MLNQQRRYFRAIWWMWSASLEAEPSGLSQELFDVALLGANAHT